ncbi:MAG: hypothetical protein IAE82_15810, partial [Opitutaceae bacterium]|nr:hypothetical protein [Opitutaceae bacterium]
MTDPLAALAPRGLRARSSSARYRAATVVVAAVMIALPVLWVLLIAAVIGLTGWHVVHHVDWVLVPRGYNRGLLFWRAVAYAAPFLIGPTLVLFLVKPLFASRRRVRGDDIALDPAREPRFAAFVQRLCLWAGATPPEVV